MDIDYFQLNSFNILINLENEQHVVWSECTIAFNGLSLINLNESMTKFVSLFIDNFAPNISLFFYWLLLKDKDDFI